MGVTAKEILMSDGLTLEKTKVVERLGDVEKALTVLITEAKITNSSIEKLNHIIIGNGEKGLAEKVRNLEDAEGKRKDYSKAVWGSIIALASKSVWDWWTGKPH